MSLVSLWRLPGSDTDDSLLIGHTRELYLAWACLVLGMAVLGLGVLVAVLMLRPEKEIWHSLDGSQEVTPNLISDRYALDWATRFVETRFSWQVATLKETQERVKAWLHPDLLMRYKVEFEKEEKEVRKALMGAQTTVVQATVIRRVDDVLLVHVVALHTVTIGDHKNPSEDVALDLALRPYPPRGRSAKLVLANISPLTPLAATGR